MIRGGGGCGEDWGMMAKLIQMQGANEERGPPGGRL